MLDVSEWSVNKREPMSRRQLTMYVLGNSRTGTPIGVKPPATEKHDPTAESNRGFFILRADDHRVAVGASPRDPSGDYELCLSAVGHVE